MARTHMYSCLPSEPHSDLGHHCLHLRGSETFNTGLGHTTDMLGIRIQAGFDSILICILC